MKYASGMETKARILEVSKQLFFKEGFKETSIRRIAKKSNLSSGALYKHFSSKEAILDCLIEPHIDQWWQKCDELFSQFELDLAKVKTAKDIEKLFNREDANWLYRYLKKDADVWRFVFFNSAGTKYEHFFDEFMEYEMHTTLALLKAIDPEQKYLTIASETEIYALIKGFYKMGLSVFEEKFDDQMRVNFFNILEGIYHPFWEKLFSINY